MSWIEQWDIAVLQWLNTDAYPFLDRFMWLCSEKLFWIPIYLLLIYRIFLKFGWKWLGVALVFIGLTVLINDQLASGLFKNWIGRLRPSHDDRIQDLLHYVLEPNGQLYKGGKFGFYSSHAANYAGITTFFILIVRPNRWWIIGLIFWTALIAYSRMYLGVHFPTDILMGLTMGCIVGWLCFKGWQWTRGRYAPKLSNL